MSKVYVDRFDTLNSFLKAIATRPLGKVFEGFDTRKGSDSSSVSFTNTKSYKESEEIMKAGYKEGLEKMKKAGRITNVNTQHPKSVPAASIIGCTPHVPNAIAGIPCSMISYKSVPMKSKMLSLVYDITASHTVDADEFVKAGRVLMAFIEKMEMKGYRVRLDMMLSACKYSENSVALIKVKDFRQPLNPLKLSYMMIHPSFLRRQGLKWIETNPKLTEGAFRKGHGTALYFQCNCDTRRTERWMRENSVIGEKETYVSFYDLRNKTPEELPGVLGIRQ